MRRIHILIAVVCLLCIGCSTDNRPSGRSGQADYGSLISLSTIAVKDFGRMAAVKTECRNISGRHLDEALVACIVYDANGNKLDFVQEHIIFSTQGGLDAGRSSYHDYMFDLTTDQIKRVGYEIVLVR